MANRILKLLLITFLFIFPIQLVFSSIPQSLPAPTHSIMFGYYHVDSQYGDFKDEVKDYTNTQLILQESFLRSDLNNIQEFNDAFDETITLGHKIVYVLGTDWNQGLNAVKPYWNNVEFIYLADEPSWDKATTETNITNFKNLVTQAGLAQKQIAINYTPQQIQTGTSYQAVNLDIIGFEAYVDPAKQDDPNILTILEDQIDASKQKIGNKKMFIVIQAYDRNGVWKNMTYIQDIQITPYLKSYNDSNVIGLFMFSYARSGGTRDNPTLKTAHQLISDTLLGKGPIESTITDVTTGWGGSLAFNPTNNTWMVVSHHHTMKDIFARLLDNNGNPLTVMTTVDQEPTFLTGGPEVAYSPDINKFLIVWWQENITDTSADIYGRFMSADGALLGNAFNLTPNDSRVPYLAESSIMQYDSRNKKFVFAFENRAPGNVSVYLKTVGIDGTVGPTLMIAENPPDFLGAPSLAINETGNEYCISYQNAGANQPNKLAAESSSLAVKRIDASTMQVGPETFVSNDMYYNGGIVYNSQEDKYFATWTNYALSTGLAKTLNSCDGTDTDDTEDIDISTSGVISYNPKSNTYALIAQDCCSVRNNYIIFDTSLNVLEQGTVFTDSKKSEITGDPEAGGNFAPVIMANTNNGTYGATSSMDYATTRFASNVGSAVLLGRTYSGSGFPPPLNLGVPSEGLPTDLGQLIEAIFSWSLSLIGLVIFVRFFYAGFLWFTAAGNTSNTSKAKDIMKNAVYGALILFSAWLILNTINPDLVGGGFDLPGLSGGMP